MGRYKIVDAIALAFCSVSCFGARIQIGGQEANKPIVFGEGNEELKFIQQRTATVRLSPSDTPGLGAVVLTEKQLCAFVAPAVPSCRPLTQYDIQRMARGSLFRLLDNHENHVNSLQVAKFIHWTMVESSHMINTGPASVGITRVTEFKVDFEIESDGRQIQKQRRFFSGMFYPAHDSAEEKLPSSTNALCAYPEEADSIDIGTIAIIRKEYWDLALRKTCTSFSGCHDEQCTQGRREWKVCFGDNHVDFVDKIVSAHVKRNGLKEELGRAIQRAALNAPSGVFAQCIAEDVIRSPASTESGFWEQNEQQVSDVCYPDLMDISLAFMKGIIPKRGGKNSKSGAKFFYSANRAFIAKQIRYVEYVDGLMKALKGGDYSRHIQRGSTLNPTYLAFSRQGENWIVMKRETLSSEIKRLLPQNAGAVEHFFNDVKPSPMTSDNAKFFRTLATEFLHTQFNLADLYGWDDMLEVADSDINFLGKHKLIDYSFWIYGSLFTLQDYNEVADWEANMASVLANGHNPGCVYGCHRPPPERPLADVTALMGPLNRIQHNGNTYKCCCVVMKQAGSFTSLSPCVLVNTKAPSQKLMKINRTGCGNLMPNGQGKWHAYFKYASSKSVTQGRCLVGLGSWVNRSFPHVLAPESIGVVAPPLAPTRRCAVVCVSIGDYFLPSDAWRKIENVVLALYYKEQKWTDYPVKMHYLLRCLGRLFPVNLDLGLHFLNMSVDVMLGFNDSHSNPYYSGYSHCFDDVFEAVGQGADGADAEAFSRRIVVTPGR